MNLLNKILRSIFTKLLLILIITGFLINFCVGIFFRYIIRESNNNSFQKNITQYINYLIKDLGEPPNYIKAMEITRQSDLKIRYESNDKTWSTDDSLSPIDKMELQTWHKNSKFFIKKKRGEFIIATKCDNYKIAFVLNFEYNHEVREKMTIVLIILLTFIILSAYFAIRLILRPLTGLSEGVKQVSEGNLKHRIICKREDEIGQLAKAFNEMTTRIQDIINSKEQLLLDVSHELRSPITRIKLAIEFLNENNIIKKIKEDIAEMEAMVTEILENARMKSEYRRLNLKKVNIKALINEIVHDFESSSHTIKFIGTSDDIILEIDPKNIKIVLKNIISNAIKYSDKTTEPVIISLKQDIYNCIIEIKDSGIGIPEKELPYIFEPFYRIDKSRSRNTGGYGLGLSLCKTIMEAHNGRIKIESSIENGTTVLLYFIKGILT